MSDASRRAVLLGARIRLISSLLAPCADGVSAISVSHLNNEQDPLGSRKNKFAILGVEAPAWQGAKTQEYLDIPSFRNAARRDASAPKM
ncbi:MAG: hypothetical protein WCE56_09025 [Desulfobacterales bacterium]